MLWIREKQPAEGRKCSPQLSSFCRPDSLLVFISSWQNLIMTIHVLWNIIAILLAISGLKLTFANEDSKPIEEEKYGVKYATDCEGKLDLSHLALPREITDENQNPNYAGS